MLGGRFKKRFQRLTKEQRAFRRQARAQAQAQAQAAKKILPTFWEERDKDISDRGSDSSSDSEDSDSAAAQDSQWIPRIKNGAPTQAPTEEPTEEPKGPRLKRKRATQQHELKKYREGEQRWEIAQQRKRANPFYKKYKDPPTNTPQQQAFFNGFARRQPQYELREAQREARAAAAAAGDAAGGGASQFQCPVLRF
jgi:hypothetical protein